MIRISQLKLPYRHTKEDLYHKIRSILKTSTPFTYEIQRQSLDARKKDEKKFVYTVDVSIENEKKVLKKVHLKTVEQIKPVKYRFPKSGDQKLSAPPVIVGSGPAGIFCAWYLARAGYRPLVLERGDEAPIRQEKVNNFWKTGVLDTESNVQFGEGGAGTFSDGKLNTLVKDPVGRNKEVLKRFVKAGAPEEILYQQKPHLGTDLLVSIVQNLRHEIEAMGGEFRFRSCVTDFHFSDGALTHLTVNGTETIETSVCILAIGHSARDTFRTLYERGLYMEPKSFAVGIRMEHPQTMINEAMYGTPEDDILKAAPYKITHTCENGRGVYSFCMCPGGYVVNASSEPESLAVNGMSYQARDSKNANSALIVTVHKEDFPGEHPLRGIEFQRTLEKAAFREGKGAIPVQLFGDFKAHRPSDHFGDVTPCMKGNYTFGNVRDILPDFIGDSLEEGILAFGKKIPGYDREDALISGVESRTSSPVRIVRDQDLTANIRGIYPCGEGAGYAGGITSAAMDGIRIAEAVAARYAALQ
ncbi:MAG: NAD(P)-binding protein [Eubacteriales bacterium]|nr:NAD(P)-binding protein [Eubacteriales bacterium]